MNQPELLLKGGVVTNPETNKQCCGSRMFILDPDFYPSRIPDPESRILDPGSKNSNKREGEKN
jgi:hypothetical protein